MADRFTNGADGFDRHKGTRVGTLWVNTYVDGDVTIATIFDTLDGVAKIDLLNDFIGLLVRERDLMIEEVWGEK